MTQPADSTLSEPLADAQVAFTDALDTKRCLWPISGQGALMQVCGQPRLEGDLAYCGAHRHRSRNVRGVASNLS